jgi:hypothetical protein
VVYRRFLDSHGRAGEPGGKLMHVGRDEARRMVEDREAYWIFPPTMEWPGTLATFK